MYARDVVMMVADLDPDYGLVSKTQAGSDYSDRSTCNLDEIHRRNSWTHEKEPFCMHSPEWDLSFTQTANTSRNKSTSDNTGQTIRWWSDAIHNA